MRKAMVIRHSMTTEVLSNMCAAAAVAVAAVAAAAVAVAAVAAAAATAAAAIRHWWVAQLTSSWTKL
jgi:hypothetical protein